jgi:3'-phosphoadenosine 5'-phosphosulfate (PAPS) 3'-phosphatase
LKKAPAGGSVTDLNGETLNYGHAERDYRIERFVACGDPTRVEHLLGYG